MMLNTARRKRLRQVLLFLITCLTCIFCIDTAPAIAVDLRWDPTFQTWPAASVGPQTFTNIGGSGVDVRISFALQAGGFNLGTPRSDTFVVPSPPNPDSQQSLSLGLNGTGNVIADIEFFATGTMNRVQVTNARLFFHEVDVAASWRDVLELAGYTGGRTGPGLGGTPVAGINVTTAAFNQQVSHVGGIVTVEGAVGDANRTTGDIRGNVTLNFSQPVDTISFIFRNPPGLTGDHLIGVGALTFDAAANPVIGVAKTVNLPVTLAPVGGAFGASTVRVNYDIIVRNLGSETLNTVQITENLNTAFGAGNYRVESLTRTAGANTVAANGGFDGSASRNLLTTVGSTLAAGANATFRLVIDINATSGTLPAQPLRNQVTATAVGATSGGNTTDLSNAGAIDPDGDGNPNEAGENTPTALSFTLTADLRLVKRITAITRGGAPLAIAGINSFNNQPSDSNDDQLQTLSHNTLPLGVFNATVSLQSGDAIEYTIYYWNNGLATASNVELCDAISGPTVLDGTSLRLAPTNPLPNLAAFGPSAALSARSGGSPLTNACLGSPGTFPPGGGVVAGGTGFDLLPQTVGAFQFRVVVP